MNYDLFSERLKVERAEAWDAWLNIPKFTPRPGWEMQVVPPFGGAMARIFIWNGEQRVSVYFDTDSRLGAMDVPYWEIYPNAEGDCSRFYTNETKDMMDAIEASFEATKEDLKDS